MQTFLPYPDFRLSAASLDMKRLGKQRVEAYQILRTLRGEAGGWSNHPATRMWRGHELALATYGAAVCAEWLRRGYRDSLLPYFESAVLSLPAAPDGGPPPWFGREDFHLSHQSNLVRKLPSHYAPLFPGVSPDLPYVWPT